MTTLLTPKSTGEVLGGLALGALVLPPVFVAKSPINGPLVHIAACAFIGLLGFVVTAPFTTRPGRIAGAACALAAAWMLSFVSYPGGVEVIAGAMGLGLGLLAGPVTRRMLVLAAAGALVLGAVGAWSAVIPVVLVAALCVAVLFAAWREPAVHHRAAWTQASITSGVVCAAVFTVFWTGSTAPKVTWFGSLESHGPRDGQMVALTFDDGPNPGYTLEVAQILDAHNAKGTFFEVGKAVEQRPDITTALLDDGHVVGNHSYFHDATSYLDPRYPELARAERVFANQVGFCPSLFRPPHGTHTPFMSQVVTNAGMNLVTWEVSAQDWVETDPQRLAENILAQVQPGSIILLHDGIDGNIGADRSVGLQALPAILDGLAARGLTPVTLDKLLNVPAQLTSDQCQRFRLSSGATASLRPDVVETKPDSAAAGR
jgi:peptidoglycan/xylan/chitin deacetylase (PgdA/CDA1 family)